MIFVQLGVKRFQGLLEEAKGLPDSEQVQAKLQQSIDYAEQHRRVIEQWNRFPHRNQILGRKDTPE
ncbi:MAG: DUF924 family protein, partial [Pedobacter sp.]